MPAPGPKPAPPAAKSPDQQPDTKRRRGLPSNLGRAQAECEKLIKKLSGEQENIRQTAVKIHLLNSKGGKAAVSAAVAEGIDNVDVEALGGEAEVANTLLDVVIDSQERSALHGVQAASKHGVSMSGKERIAEETADLLAHDVDALAAADASQESARGYVPPSPKTPQQVAADRLKQLKGKRSKAARRALATDVVAGRKGRHKFSKAIRKAAIKQAIGKLAVHKPKKREKFSAVIRDAAAKAVADTHLDLYEFTDEDRRYLASMKQRESSVEAIAEDMDSYDATKAHHKRIDLSRALELVKDPDRRRKILNSIAALESAYTGSKLMVSEKKQKAQVPKEVVKAVGKQRTRWHDFYKRIRDGDGMVDDLTQAQGKKLEKYVVDVYNKALAGGHRHADDLADAVNRQIPWDKITHNKQQEEALAKLVHAFCHQQPSASNRRGAPRHNPDLARTAAKQRAHAVVDNSPAIPINVPTHPTLKAQTAAAVDAVNKQAPKLSASAKKAIRQRDAHMDELHSDASIGKDIHGHELRKGDSDGSFAKSLRPDVYKPAAAPGINIKAFDSVRKMVHDARDVNDASWKALKVKFDNLEREHHDLSEAAKVLGSQARPRGVMEKAAAIHNAHDARVRQFRTSMERHLKKPVSSSAIPSAPARSRFAIGDDVMVPHMGDANAGSYWKRGRVTKVNSDTYGVRFKDGSTHGYKHNLGGKWNEKARFKETVSALEKERKVGILDSNLVQILGEEGDKYVVMSIGGKTQRVHKKRLGVFVNMHLGDVSPTADVERAYDAISAGQSKQWYISPGAKPVVGDVVDFVRGGDVSTGFVMPLPVGLPRGGARQGSQDVLAGAPAGQEQAAPGGHAGVHATLRRRVPGSRAGPERKPARHVGGSPQKVRQPSRRLCARARRRSQAGGHSSLWALHARLAQPRSATEGCVHCSGYGGRPQEDSGGGRCAHAHTNAFYGAIAAGASHG